MKSENHSLKIWWLVVPLNAGVGMAFGLGAGAWWNLGIILGILTWVPAYAAIDCYAKALGAHRFSRSLLIAAIARLFLQLIIVIDVFIGFWSVSSASNFAEILGINDNGLFVAYVATVLGGLFLSSVVFFFMLLMVPFRRK